MAAFGLVSTRRWRTAARNSGREQRQVVCSIDSGLSAIRERTLIAAFAAIWNTLENPVSGNTHTHTGIHTVPNQGDTEKENSKLEQIVSIFRMDTIDSVCAECTECTVCTKIKIRKTFLRL